jgi:monoamine oxidase
MHFAGEAVCFGLNGYLHGALFSGQKAAREVLWSMGAAPQPQTSICDLYR